MTASLSKSDSTNTYLNQNRAEPGDTITLTIEADEPLDYLEVTDVSMSGSRVLISSVAESDEGSTWVATGTVQATSDDDEELSYSIVSFQDEAGNSGTNLLFLQSNMTDRIPSSSTRLPLKSSVTASLSKSDSTNTYLNQNRAEPGDTITLTIEADEPLDYLEDTDVSMSGSRVLISSVQSLMKEGRGLQPGRCRQPAMTTRSSHTA